MVPSYVFSDDPEQALRVADGLATGMVYVNGVGLDGAELGRVGVVLGVVDQQYLGRDLVADLEAVDFREAVADDAAGAIRDEGAALVVGLVGVDQRRADDGDQFAVATRLDAENAEAALIIVESDPFDYAGNFPVTSLRSGIAAFMCGDSFSHGWSALGDPFGKAILLGFACPVGIRSG